MKGKDVKKILEENDYSLAEIARKMNISPQSLQNILKSQDIKTGVLNKIAKVINKSIYFFLGDYDTTDIPQNKKTSKKNSTEDKYLVELIEMQKEKIERLEREIRGLKKEQTTSYTNS